MKDSLIHDRTARQIEKFVVTPSHAVSVNGLRGAGKSHVAKHLIAGVLKADPQKLADHPYVLIIDTEAKKSGIDEVREIKKFLALTVPGEGAYKRAVMIIGLDNLGHEAQNALLKTIEEPPSDTLIVVIYNHKTGVLPTLQSRLQEITILPVDFDSSHNYFSNKFNEDLISKAYYISGGQVGLMTSILEDSDDHQLLIAIEEARRILGLSRYKRLAEIERLLKNKETSPDLLLEGLFRLIDAGYKRAAKSSLKQSKELKAYVSRLQLLNNAIEDIQNNVQPKLVFSRLLLQI